MFQRRIVLVATLLLSVVAAVLGLGEVAYLRRGYSLTISLGSARHSLYPIQFPLWLKLAHALTNLGILASLALCAMFRPAAVWIAWTTLALATAVGLYDVRQYGFNGTPTSAQSFSLVLGIAILMSHWRTKGVLRP